MKSADPITFEDLVAGGKAALARALAQIEAAGDAVVTLALLSAAFAAPRAHVIGVTGPPGVGKSTLLATVITRLRKQGRSVGVIAVDPSSKITGGALLGDRIRLQTDPEDAGVFVRSMAARDRLGGLAEITVAAMVLMRAVYDVVLIETVGVGQSETDVVGVADTVVFCVQPGSGDSLQFMKAGIVEIPDIVVVTKSDMESAARQARADIKSAIKVTAGELSPWPAKVLSVSALKNQGIDDLIAAIDDHWAWLQDQGRLVLKRQAQAAHWLVDALRERYGREGLKHAGALALGPDQSPFDRLAEISRQLRVAWRV
ncbi:MAG: methylmalonyl Co-A mutase-associated GTPase MeaB [Alphaproteobacteria bacterium]